ncbi:MAG: hypothetical protein ABL977_16575, partial [Candidatus Eisenbacteria bacterium]
LTVRAETPRQAASRDKLPRLTATAESLAILVSGAVSPLRAAEAGLVEDQRGAAELMEPWFRTRPVFLMPMNAF